MMTKAISAILVLLLSLAVLTGCLDGGNVDVGRDGYLGDEESEYVRPDPSIEDPADALSDALSDGRELIPDTMDPANGFVTDVPEDQGDNGVMPDDASPNGGTTAPSSDSTDAHPLNEFGGSAVNGDSSGH